MSGNKLPISFKSVANGLSRSTPSELQCFRIDGATGRLIAIPLDQLVVLMAESDDDFWIDVETTQPQQLEPFLLQLGLHPLIIEDCLDPYRSPRFSSFASSLHFEFPIYKSNSLDEYLSVICIPRVLVTIRTTDMAAVADLAAANEGDTQPNRADKSALLYTMLDALGDQLIYVARESRNEIRRLSQEMDENANKLNVEEIIATKRTLQDLAMIAEDQLYCIRALISVETTALNMSQQNDYLRDATGNYETALRVIQRYEQRASELHEQFHMSLQAKTEKRIRILTILSSVCMPLTLIAGIYGMNFSSMPELQTSWGYPLTLLIMFAIAAGQLWFFYRHKWLG